MRKRSKYRPKGVQKDPLNWILNGFTPVRNLDAITTQRIKAHGVIDSVRRGEATRNDMDALIAVFNMAEALVSLGIGGEYVDEVHAGQMALLVLSRRGIARDMRFICTAQELTAINNAMEIHDAQLEVSTVIDIENGLKIIDKAIRSQKAHTVFQKEAV